MNPGLPDLWWTFYSLGQWLINLVGRVFANGLEDLGSIPGLVIPKTLKIVLSTSLLSNIRYVSRVKQSNPGQGVAPAPTPQCSSYWKGSLLVALDYGCQLYLLLLYYICKNFSIEMMMCALIHKFLQFTSRFLQYIPFLTKQILMKCKIQRSINDK